VRELIVPEVADDPFREHFRELILGSVLRSAEAQSERHRARGHRFRARRAERVAERLRPPPAAQPPVSAPVQVIEPEPVPAVVVEPEPVSAVAVEPAPVRVEVEYEPRFGSRLRVAAGLVWLATFAVLVCDIAAFGIESWATSAADLGLIVMTLVWFCVCIDDLVAPDGPRVQQLELYE
jgi:hypothetical protein